MRRLRAYTVYVSAAATNVLSVTGVTRCRGGTIGDFWYLSIRDIIRSHFNNTAHPIHVKYMAAALGRALVFSDDYMRYYKESH